MRSSNFLFAGLVAVAYAQIDASVIAEIPSCATGPLVSGISGSGCQITDSACICGNQKLISDLQTAVKAQCSEADLAKALAVTSQICPQAAAAPAAAAASSASEVATSAAAAASSASEVATSAAAAASSVSSVAATAAITTDPSPEEENDYDEKYTYPTCPAFKEIGKLRGPFDLGLIPIGAYDPRFIMSPMHANPFDSVNIFIDTQCKKALGIHWGTWVLTEEDVLEPPRVLKEAMAWKDLPETGVFDTCDIGESLEY